METTGADGKAEDSPRRAAKGNASPKPEGLQDFYQQLKQKASPAIEQQEKQLSIEAEEREEQEHESEEDSEQSEQLELQLEEQSEEEQPEEEEQSDEEGEESDDDVDAAAPDCARGRGHAVANGVAHEKRDEHADDSDDEVGAGELRHEETGEVYSIVYEGQGKNILPGHGHHAGHQVVVGTTRHHGAGFELSIHR